MGAFEVLRRNSSVSIAKERIRLLVVSDRMNCSPDALDNLHRELYQTISKYMEVIPEEFNVQITHSNIVIHLTGEEE